MRGHDSRDRARQRRALNAAALTPLERLLSRIVPLRPGEGPVVLLLFANIFLLLFGYYLVKPVREMLILAESSAEVRSYAVAAQALSLLVVIPVYTAFLRRVFPHYHLVPWIAVFLASNLLVFVLCGHAGVPIGVPFFIWLGVYNVMIVAQFWAFAADLFSVEAGERLFVPVSVGASLGAWAGSVASRFIIGPLGPFGMMWLAIGLLLATVPFVPMARRRVPHAARAPVAARVPHPEEIRGTFAGFRMVLADPYLRLLGLFVLLLNCTNSTGEYLLARVVKAHAGTLASAGEIHDVGAWIGGFYGDYFAWYNSLGLLVQLLLVGRIFRVVGVGRSAMILPLFSAIGYAALAVMPVFTLTRLVMIGENSLNYSLANTTRNALILPTDEEQKYAGKTTIDTFCWRFGDLIQAGLVWAGAEWLGASAAQFALMNATLALAWLAAAVALGARHRGRVAALPAAANA